MFLTVYPSSKLYLNRAGDTLHTFAQSNTVCVLIIPQIVYTLKISNYFIIM